MKKLFAIIGLLLIAIVIFLGWGLGTANVTSAEHFELDMSKLRAAATASGEPLPAAVQEFVIAEGEFPKFVVISGTSLFEKQNMVFRSHIISYADGRTVMIDPIQDAATHLKLFGPGFHESSWNKQQKAMHRATLVLATHEHVDHVGGIAASDGFASLAPQVALTEEQLNSFAIADSGFDDERLAQLTPLRYDDYYSPMPGIALKKAPGHSPGSQIIYVQLANGREYLFVGDIAWNWQNILQHSGRARLVSSFFLREDQGAVASQLATLEQLSHQADLNIIISHDQNRPAP